MSKNKKHKQQPTWLKSLKKIMPTPELFVRIVCIVLVVLILLGMLTTFLY
jgi:energy-converting hydrogenase Eha subunit F